MTTAKVLDACRGSKMFWFNKHHPDAIYLDCRKETIEFQGFHSEVDPDVLADFTNLPFPNNTFNLVVFDPPHLTWAGPKSWLRAKYGVLEDNWPDMIRDGFKECFRVLKPGGALIFKWSEVQIPLKKVLACTDHKPLFGNHKPQQSKTHWICFMKEED